MPPEVFHRRIEALIPEYAADHVRDGQWTEDEALERSRQEVHGLLPEGVETPHHHLWVLEDDAGQDVGWVWCHIDPERPERAFIYQILVDEAHRRQGHAIAALQALEAELKGRGVKRLGLHVFGGNTGARALYRQLGYEETNVVMAKAL